MRPTALFAASSLFFAACAGKAPDPRVFEPAGPIPTADWRFDLTEADLHDAASELRESLLTCIAGDPPPRLVASELKDPDSTRADLEYVARILTVPTESNRGLPRPTRLQIRREGFVSYRFIAEIDSPAGCRAEWRVEKERTPSG